MNEIERKHEALTALNKLNHKDGDFETYVMIPWTKNNLYL